DGRDLRTFQLADVRRHVGLVEQTPFLFHATIAENLRYARPEATEAELAAAAEAAGLGELIARLPRGTETVVGERGTALSAGERQRLASAPGFPAPPSPPLLGEAPA